MQLTQVEATDAPAEGEKVPRLQREQADIMAAEAYDPAWHWVHAVDEVALANCPAVQLEQELFPAAEE